MHLSVVQGDAKTVLYVAAYDDGEYRGAVSFVTCKDKRFWSTDKRRELSEVVKLFSVYRKKRMVLNHDDSKGQRRDECTYILR